MRPPYNRKKTGVRDVIRVVAELPTETVEKVDAWAIPAGLPSRTAALQELLSKGLQTVQAESQRAS